MIKQLINRVLCRGGRDQHSNKYIADLVAVGVKVGSRTFFQSPDTACVDVT